jgi:hypothetical protein
MKQEYVTLGVQAGDKAADNAVSPYYLRLRKSFAENCRRGYGADLRELSLVLRIDGDLWNWGKIGAADAKFERGKRISVEIFMPENVWKGTSSDIVKFLSNESRKAFHGIEKLLCNSKRDIDMKSLSNDYFESIRKFAD